MSMTQGSDSGMKPMKKQKNVEPLDAKRMADLMGVRNGLQNNIPGTTINGTKLLSPARLYSNSKQTESNERLTKPDTKEMDILYQSFKPGLSEQRRYEIQDLSSFYKTAFPQSAYNTRVNSFAARIASADQTSRNGVTQTGGTQSSSKKVKLGSLQATCKDMKAEVTKAQSMHNYSIKAKHMGTMTNFFASKNFELTTRMPTPPLRQNNKDATPIKGGKAAPAGDKKTTQAVAERRSSIGS